MPKEFRYRGKTLEELNAMSTEALLQLLPSRARRSLNRGVSEEKRKLLEDARAKRDGKLEGEIKTHARDMVVLPTMVGLTIGVHNGREFVITNKKVVHGTPGIGSSRSSLYVPLK